MTIQEANTQIQAIAVRTDISAGQKQALMMRIRNLARRDNPDAADDLL